MVRQAPSGASRLKRLTLGYLARQNLRRKPFRSLAILLGVALVSGTLMATTLVTQSVRNSLAVGMKRLGADLLVVPEGQEQRLRQIILAGDPSEFYMDQSVLDRVREVPGVAQVSPQVFLQSLTKAQCCSGHFFLIGFDPATDFTIQPWRTTPAQKGPWGDHDILVGHRLQMEPGDIIRFYGTKFTVKGRLDRTGMGLDVTVFIPLRGIRDLVEGSKTRAEKVVEIRPNQISAVLVRLQPGANLQEMARAIDQAVDHVHVVVASHLVRSTTGQMEGVLRLARTAASLAWGLLLPLIALIFSMMVSERQRQLGLLRALGATRDFVFKLVLTEAALLTGGGAAVGIAVSTLLSYSFRGLLEQVLRVPFLWPPAGEMAQVMALLLILGLLTGLYAALYPAYRSSRMEPYQAIRRGE